MNYNCKAKTELNDNIAPEVQMIYLGQLHFIKKINKNFLKIKC